MQEDIPIARLGFGDLSLQLVELRFQPIERHQRAFISSSSMAVLSVSSAVIRMSWLLFTRSNRASPMSALILPVWTYNNERPNMGINGMTPAVKLKTAA